MYGVALGPAIGWLYEGVDAVRQRNVASLQIIWNMLEQYPGDEQIAAAKESGADTGYMIRVPHSSGMLEGHYTADTTFPKGDHRRHRPREWLVNGIEKVAQLRFLERPDRTLGQAAIAWLLAEPRVMTRAAEHLRSRAARRVCRSAGRAAAGTGGTGSHRRALQRRTSASRSLRWRSRAR